MQFVLKCYYHPNHSEILITAPGLNSPLLPIVTNQRERLKQRNAELEMVCFDNATNVDRTLLKGVFGGRRLILATELR